LFYAELLMDAGCTAWTSQLAAAILGDEIVARREWVFFTNPNNPIEVLNWLRTYVAADAPVPARSRQALKFALHGKDSTREGFRNTCESARRFAQRLGMPEDVQAALFSVFEQWDGKGPHGTVGESIPIVSRIVYVTSFLEAFSSIGGRSATTLLAEKKRGNAFDPVVVDAFLSLAEDEVFWDGLEQESAWTSVSGLEPPSPYQFLREDQLEDVALAFADFADLKTFYTAGHSRRTADLAESMARQLRLPHDDVSTIRRAAMMHDIGLVTVPSFVLQKPNAKLTTVEWEGLRLHPYQGERILARVPAFEPVLPLVAAHHERMDGQGYYRGLSGSQIPLGARVIAVADQFDTLTHETPDHPALPLEDTLNRIQSEMSRGFWPDAVEALGQVVQGGGHGRRMEKVKVREWPAGLTDREVEIVRLLTRGLSRREMAAQLFLSEHTVRHHLEHIYNKIGVSTRVAATLFAVEQGLLD